MRTFKRTRDISICVVLFLLVIPGFLIGLNGFNLVLTNQSLDYDQEKSKISAYTSLAPIYIDGNFSAAKTYYGWSGSGTFLSPYIIENISVSSYATKVGLSIYNSNDYFIVKDSEFRNLLMGIDISNSYFGTIDNVTVAQNLDGINIDGSTITIQNSKLQQNMDSSSNYAYGIYAYNSNVTILNNYIYYSEYGIYNGGNGNYAIIKDNDVVSNTQYGIYSFATISNVTIENNYISGTSVSAISVNGPIFYVINNTLSYFGQVGIVVSGTNSVGGLVTKNILQASSNLNYHKGIYIYNKANNNLVFNNTIYNCDQYGLYIWDATGNQIYNNTLIDNSVGIYVYSADYNNISANTIYTTSFSYTGIKLDTVNHGMVKDNVLFNMSTAIESVQNVTNNTISFNSISSSYLGVKAKDNNRIANNTFSELGIGIQLTSTNNNVNNNTITCNTGSSTYGILLYAGYNNLVSNTISGCSSGIFFRTSPLNNVSKNNLFDSSFGFYDSAVIGDYIETITADNYLNNELVLYYENADKIVLSSGTTNQIIIVNSTNMVITGKTMTGSRNILSYYSTNLTVDQVTISNTLDKAIDFYYTTNATIENSNINSFYKGYSIRQSNNVTISNNVLTNGVSGIVFENSLYGYISNNTLSNMTSYGMWFNSNNHNNSIVNNNISTVSTAFRLDNSNYNFISGNKLQSENSYALYLTSSNSNTIDLNTMKTSSSRSLFHYQSTSNSLTNDIFIGSIFIDGSSQSHFLLSAESNNTVNGEPFLYVNGITGGQYLSDYGQIYILNSADINIENQIFSNQYLGIYVAYSTNITIKNSQFTNTDYAIKLLSVSNSLIVNNVFSTNYYGVEVKTSPGNSIITNTFSYDKTAIYATSTSTSLQLINNVIEHTWDDGIYLSTANNGQIINNIVYNSSTEGISVISSTGLIVSGNKIYNGHLHGIYLQNSNSFTMTNNSINNNADSGIKILNSVTGTISNSTITNNIIAGIYITDSLSNPDYLDIRANEISYNGRGIFFDSVLESNITKNNLTYNYNAIYITGSEQNSISSNIFKYNQNYTLYFTTSPNNEIIANDFLYNNQNGTNGYLTDKNHFVFNYYSDWAKIVTDANKDNILDDPYVFDGSGNNIDLYPLANSFTEPINNTIVVIVTNTTYINIPVYNNLTETTTVYSTIIKNASSTTSSETNASDFSLEGMLLAVIIVPSIALTRRKMKQTK